MTFVYVPWDRSGTSTKSTCARYKKRHHVERQWSNFSSEFPVKRFYCFCLAFGSQGISPACSADLGRSPTWWKSVWKSQTRTSTLKVRRCKHSNQLSSVLVDLRMTLHCSVCVALQVVFGSLYRDDVLIKPSRVVSILAAACMLQLVSKLKRSCFLF